MASRTFSIDFTKVIGSGSYGKVYEGEYQDGRWPIKKVAIKKIALLQQDRDSNREQDALLQLDHPNVVRLFHWEDDDEFRYLVLELCAGTLGDFLSRKYKGPMVTDLDGLHQMAAGVQHIHSKGLVHRDLKPENILISRPRESGEIQLKISDFGFCKKTTERGTFSLTSGIKGTESYLAPELIAAVDQANARASTKSDVFALGCVFFKFLTRGFHPFGDGLMVSARIARGEFNLQKLQEDPFNSIHYNLVQQMIQLKPEDRPDASAVADQVARVLLDRATDAVDSLIVREIPGKVLQCLFHPSGAKLACASDGGRIYIFGAPNPATSFDQWNEEILQATTTGTVNCIDWNVDGRHLAAGCNDGTIVVWQTEGKSFESKRHSERISCIRWNKAPEYSHLLITGSDDKTTIIWDTGNRTNLQTFRFHGDWVNDVTWISTDVFASCSRDGTIKIGQRGRSTPSLTFSHQRQVFSVRWMAQVEQFASCSADGTVKVWSLNERNPVVTLVGDGHPICCFDWHPVGRRIAGGSAASSFSVFLWHVPAVGPFTAPQILRGHSSAVKSVAFSSNGELLASVNYGGDVVIWNVQRGAAIFNQPMGCTISNFQVSSWDPSSSALAVPAPSSVRIINPLR